MTEPVAAKNTASTNVLLITGAWAVLGCVAAMLPLRNWDYWFHLTVGRLLDVHHAIPTTNLFGFSAPATTAVYIHTWIGDYWLFSLHQFGGLVATLAVRNLCALFALGVLSWSTYRLTGRNAAASSVATLIGGLTFFAAAGFAGPQMFVWPVFALLAALLVASRSWTKMWGIPVATALATAFWANTAPNFWAPAALTGAFALAAQFSHDPRRRNWYLVACVTSIAGMLATPLGIRVFLALLNGAGSEAWLALGAPLAIAPIIANAPRFERQIPRAALVAAVAGMVVLVLSIQPWSDAHQALPAAVFGDAVRQEDPLRGLGPSNTPVEAVELLKSWGSQPRVYAAPHLSGYLLYELQDPKSPQPIVWPLPDWTPTEDIAQTERAMSADPEVFRGVLHQMGVKAVLVTPELGRIGEFVANAPDWVLIGTWESGALYVSERRD